MAKYLLLLITLFHLSCSTMKNSRQPQFTANPTVAHRGAFKKNNLPENSIAALEQAIKIGCTGSEFDVRMTSDDSLVINHDPHYNKLEIEKSTYDQLAQYPLSNGEVIPTLREYLKAGLKNNRSTRLICEIKPASSSQLGEKIAEKVLAQVEELGAKPFIVYISFDYGILKKILQLDPNANTQYLNGDKSPLSLKQDGIRGADYHFSVFQKHPEWIAEALQNNIDLNAWTVNEEKDMNWLLKEGFQFITTNEPELLLSKTSSKK